MLLDILDELSVSPQTSRDLCFDVLLPSAFFLVLSILGVVTVVLFDFARADHCVEILTGIRDEIRHKDLFLVLVSSHKGHILSYKRMPAEMSVNFTQLDSESTDLDLVVSSTGALDRSIRQVSSEITGSVHSVSDTLPVLRSRGRGRSVNRMSQSIGSFDAFPEPVLDKLFGSRSGIQVTLAQASGSNVDLSDLSNRTRDISLCTVDNQQLHIDHSLSGGHDILLVL